MLTGPIQFKDVIYNAATRSFEALVAVHDNGQTYKYACAIEAPISMPFEDAARGLCTQARRRHMARGGLRSVTQRHIPVNRNGRPKFDPVRWLEMLINRPDANAA